MGGISIKVAIVGSRSLNIEIANYIPDGVTEIISGGARGIDNCAVQCAHLSNLKLTKFFPEYEKYGRTAPLKRNETIVDKSDLIVAVWDGASRGTKYAIDYARKKNKTVILITLSND